MPFFFCYLTRVQRDIFEVFDGVTSSNWGLFKEAVHESFAGAFKVKKHILASLDTFIKQSASQPILSDSAMHAYHRQFQGIVNYLIKEKELADSDKDHHYWFGLHPHTRLVIEHRLAITLPEHPCSKPYSVAEVYTAGCYVFDVNAFDLNLPDRQASIGYFGATACCFSCHTDNSAIA